MSRKIILVIVLVSLLAVGVQAQQEDITLTFSHFWTEADGDSGEIVQARLDAWLAEHPNVTLDTEIISHDEYYTKFRVQAAANELPDVFIMNADMTTPLANSGQLLDLTGALDANPAWRDLINPGLMAEWTRDSNAYAVPAQVIITHQIFFNEEVLSEVGYDTFPQTWEELTDMVGQLQEAGYIPIALGAKAGWPLFDSLFGTLAFRATGLDWYNRLLAHEASFTDPEFVRALELLKQLAEMGAFNEDATSIDNMQARSLFFNRDAAMFIEGGWAIAGGIDVEDVESVTNIALWPAVPEGLGAPNEVTWASGWGWAANANLTGAEAEAAVSLIEALSDEDYGRSRNRAWTWVAAIDH